MHADSTREVPSRGSHLVSCHKVYEHHPMLSAFEEALARKNKQLKAMREPALQMHEVIHGTDP